MGTKSSYKKRSLTGYKKDSPDKNKPVNIIPSGNITMKDVEFPVWGIDNLGNKQLMMPEQEYQFPGSEVTEYPMHNKNNMQSGGPVPRAPLPPPLPLLGPTPTYADSAALYENALLKQAFYTNNPDYDETSQWTDFTDKATRDKLIAAGSIFDHKIDQNQIDDFGADQNTLGEDRFGRVSGTNLTSFGDVLESAPNDRFNPNSPPILLHPNISPQGSTSYKSSFLSDYSDVPYYNPAVVKPWRDRTDAEKRASVPKIPREVLTPMDSKSVSFPPYQSPSMEQSNLSVPPLPKQRRNSWLDRYADFIEPELKQKYHDKESNVDIMPWKEFRDISKEYLKNNANFTFPNSTGNKKRRVTSGDTVELQNGGFFKDAANLMINTTVNPIEHLSGRNFFNPEYEGQAFEEIDNVVSQVQNVATDIAGSYFLGPVYGAGKQALQTGVDLADPNNKLGEQYQPQSKIAAVAGSVGSMAAGSAGNVGNTGDLLSSLGSAPMATGGYNKKKLGGSYSSNCGSHQMQMGGDISDITPPNTYHAQAGGTHSQNPLGGIPIGGNNSIEENETMVSSENTDQKDYVFSNRILITKELAAEFNLPKNMIGKSFSDASLLLDKFTS